MLRSVVKRHYASEVRDCQPQLMGKTRKNTKGSAAGGATQFSYQGKNQHPPKAF